MDSTLGPGGGTHVNTCHPKPGWRRLVAWAAVLVLAGGGLLMLYGGMAGAAPGAAGGCGGG